MIVYSLRSVVDNLADERESISGLKQLIHVVVRETPAEGAQCDTGAVHCSVATSCHY